MPKIDKLYMNRKYDQWRGKELYVEDEVDKSYYVHIPDVDMTNTDIDAIFVEFRDVGGSFYGAECKITDKQQRIIEFQMPTPVMANDGKYQATFSILYLTNNEEYLDKSAIQTFTIVDTIDAGNGYATIEEILMVLNSKGYITQEILDSILDNYVMKEEGKGLSTHDLTDELYQILTNFTGDGEIDLTAYQLKIDEALNTMNKTIVGSINEINDKMPTNTSQLINDSGFITTEDIGNINIEGLATEEFVNEAIDNAIDNIEVPTKTSQLTNDSNFVDETFVTNAIAEAQLEGGEVDLSGYVTKETGNANQITFNDGQTFQAKLDSGALKGEKGDKGEQGIQGLPGTDGQDGLTTSVSVNGTTYNHVNGTITLPNYPTVPIATSQLINDSNFVDETYVTNAINNAQLGGSEQEVDLSIYQTKIDDTLNTTDKTVTGAINEVKVIVDDVEKRLTEAEVDIVEVVDNLGDMTTRVEYLEEKQLLISSFDGSYDSLTNKPTIPTATSELTNDSNFVTTSEMTEAIANAQLEGGEVDLSGYAKITDIPTNVSQLTNDSGYLTEHQSLEGYAKTTDIPVVPTTLSSFANDTGFITSADIPEIPSIDGLASETYVDNKVANLVGTAPETLDTLNELSQALGNDPNFATTISTQIGNKADKTELPTKVSDLTNDTGFITVSDIPEVNLTPYQTITDNTLTTTNKTIPGAINEVKTSVDNIVIPSNISDLNNDSGYITSVPDEYVTETELTAKNFATVSQLHSHTNKTVLDGITAEKVISWDAKSDFSGSYNDLTDKPDIPDSTSDLINDSDFTTKTYVDNTFATPSYVANKIAEASLSGSEVDLSGLGTDLTLNGQTLKLKNSEGTEIGIGVVLPEWFSGDYNDLINKPTNLATINDIPTALSSFTNDTGFITSVPEEYITETELTSKGYATTSQLHEHTNKTVLDGITTDKVASWDAKSDFSGSYNDLTDTPIIPIVTNDLTDTLKANYDTAYTHSQSAHAPVDAEANVQADWNETDISSDSYILNKPTNLATINDIPTIPSNISAFTNDAGFITNADIPTNYVTTDVGNASQITFADGQTFQSKLDSGVLKGEAGANGQDGEDGENGATFTPSVSTTGDLSWTNDKGLINPTPVNIKGEKGDKGDTGEQGIQGEKGDTGANGQDGYTPIKGVDYFDGEKGDKGDKGDPFTYADFTEEQLASLKGEKGDKGDTGETGANGQDGLTTSVSVNGTTYNHVNGTITLPNYPSVPTNISSFTNDSGYITSVPDEYITEDELNAKGYAPINSPDFTGDISMGRKADTTIGTNSTALGNNIEASGMYSHAEGNSTIAKGYASHVEGTYTIVGENTIGQHVQGRYNIEDTVNTYAHIVGNGTDDTNRSNAHTLDWNGNAWYQGIVSCNGTPTNANDLITKAYFDANSPTGLGYATESYVDDKISEMVGTAPEALDTLNELASALGNDPNFATTMTTLIGTKADNSHRHDSLYASITSEHTHENKSILDLITSTKYAQWDAKSDFSGSYNDLTDKPEIYTLPVATTDTLGGIKVGAGLSINDGVLSANGGGTADSVDWVNVQNRPTALSDFTNDSGFATETYVQTYVEENSIDTDVVEGDVTTGDIPTGGSTTVTWDNIAGKPTFATVATSGSYNDLTDKPTIITAVSVNGNTYTQVDGVIALPDYPTVDVTKDYVDGLVGDIDAVLDSINGEVI